MQEAQKGRLEDGLFAFGEEVDVDGDLEDALLEFGRDLFGVDDALGVLLSGDYCRGRRPLETERAFMHKAQSDKHLRKTRFQGQALDVASYNRLPKPKVGIQRLPPVCQSRRSATPAWQKRSPLAAWNPRRKLM